VTEFLKYSDEGLREKKDSENCYRLTFCNEVVAAAHPRRLGAHCAEKWTVLAILVKKNAAGG
jgi:hypothetical protein